MAATIRILDGRAFEHAVRIFQRFGEAIPTTLPDTYSVSEATLQRLQDGDVRFDTIDPAQHGLLPITEEMFAELRHSYEDLRASKLVTFADLSCLKEALDS